MWCKFVHLKHAHRIYRTRSILIIKEFEEKLWNIKIIMRYLINVFVTLIIWSVKRDVYFLDIKVHLQLTCMWLGVFSVLVGVGTRVPRTQTKWKNSVSVRFPKLLNPNSNQTFQFGFGSVRFRFLHIFFFNQFNITM